MPLHAVAVLIAGVITLYVGAVHLLIFAPRLAGRVHLSFGVTCVLIACYDFLCTGLYSSTSVAAGAGWQRWQAVALALISWALPWFVVEYLGLRVRPWLKVLAVYAVLAALANVLLPAALTWQADNPSVKHVSLFGLLQATYHESTPGPVTNVQSAIGMLIALATVGVCAWGLRRQPSRNLPLFIAIVVFALGVASDTLVSSGITTSFYLIEYSYLGLVLLMTVPLSQGVVQSALMREALAAEKERLMVTLRSIGDAVIATDGAGRVQLMNEVAEALTGWREAEALGRNLDEVFVIENERDGGRCESPVRRVLRSGAVATLANHTVLVSRDGRRRPIADSGAPIRGADGRTMGVVLVFRDMTERRLLEEKLLKAQRLESLGVLAGGIAHDVNNLLAGVYGFVDVARTAGSTEECRTVLGEALRTMERARGFTQQLLTFARGGAPVMRVTALGRLIEENTRFALSGSTVAPAFDIAPDLWPCAVDPAQISQVIDNLVINAQQAMPAGGTVHVSAQNVRRTSGPLLPEGPYVCIRVSDSGTGIPPELLPRVFDPFFTTKQKGSGLGLATAYSVVTRHGGLIEVESTLGKGSTFTVHLPARPDARPEPQGDSQKPVRGSGTVLVMDDTAPVRDVAVRMLRAAGYEPLAAACAEEARAIAQERAAQGKPLDACLLDLTIAGGRGGEEVAAEFARLYPDVTLVAVSGYSDSNVLADPKAHGFHGAVRKPFTSAELTAALSTAIRSRAQSGG